MHNPPPRIWGWIRQSLWCCCQLENCIRKFSRMQIIVSTNKNSPQHRSNHTLSGTLVSISARRLIKSVYQALWPTLKISKTYSWLDSAIALWWIAGMGKEFKTFVQNGVREIWELAPPETSRHVSSLQNPADIAFCGYKASQLKKDKKWWEGPVRKLRPMQCCCRLRGTAGKLNMSPRSQRFLQAPSDNLLLTLHFIKGAEQQQPQLQRCSLDVFLLGIECSVSIFNWS